MTSHLLKRSPGRPKTTLQTGKNKVLAAAVKIFALQGYEKTTLRAIAKLAGCDVSVVSHHFGSKLALWHTVVSTIKNESQPKFEKLRTIVSGDLPLQDRLAFAIDFLIEALASKQNVYMFVRREIVDPTGRQSYLMGELVKPYYETLAPLWREAMQHRLIPHTNTTLYQMGLLGMIANVLSSLDVINQITGERDSMEELKRELKTLLIGQEWLPRLGKSN